MRPRPAGNVKNGKYDPSLPLAFKIADLFEKKIEEIFDPDGEVCVAGHYASAEIPKARKGSLGQTRVCILVCHVGYLMLQSGL
jgi:DNA-binding XRE family transcriptional regulator